MGLVLILLGVLLLLDSLAILDFDFISLVGKFWPLILIFIGAWIILSPKKDHTFRVVTEHDILDATKTDSAFLGVFGDIRVVETGQFSGPIDKSLLVGDIVIDLRNSKIANGENHVSASVLLGDIDIIIPSDCPASIDLSCLLGSATSGENSSDGFAPRINLTDPNYDRSTAKLKISGRALVGDVKVEKA